jgi:hypothetical protein
MDFCYNLKKPIIICQNLEQFGVSFTNIDDESLNEIIKNSTKLKSLVLMKCPLLNSPTIDSTSIEELNFYGSHNIEEPKLKGKNLKNLNLNWTKVNDGILESIVNNCDNLVNLEVDLCDYLVSPTINSKTLEEISFKGSENLNSPIFNCNKLKFANFDNCKNIEKDIFKNNEIFKNVNRILNFE